MRMLIIGAVVMCVIGALTAQSLNGTEVSPKKELSEAHFAFHEPAREASRKTTKMGIRAATIKPPAPKPVLVEAPIKTEVKEEKPRKASRNNKPRANRKSEKLSKKKLGLKQLPDSREAMMKRFKDPVKFGADIRPGKSGPANSDWEDHYRGLIKTNAKAEEKGFPSHTDSKDAILAAAASDSDNIDQHLYWLCFTKKFSQKYRPEEATDALQDIYAKLLDIKYGNNAKGS